MPVGRLLAISDLHVAHPENREVISRLRPTTDQDWLIVAGDVADQAADVHWALTQLREHFSTVIWTPGNHELWTVPKDPVQLRGDHRYRHLVEACRSIGVLTPEDPYPVWTGPGGPVAVAPLFLLYDYSFLPPGAANAEEALAQAVAAGVIGSDEVYLHADPYQTKLAWCRARVAQSQARLDELPADLPTVLVNHFPLTQEPTRVLNHPQFSLWCGSTATADWHVRYRAAAVVYGHLHIPRLMWADGVPFHEVSLGYPREWGRRSTTPGRLHEILG